MDFKRGDLIIKNVKKVSVVVYEGRGVSSNSFYAGSASKKGWGMRMGLKKKYNEIFTRLLNDCEDLSWMETFKIVVFYRSKQDPDNISGTIKFTLDALKQEREGHIVVKKGWVYDDSPKYCKGVYIQYDEALPNNTFQFFLLKLS
jgi:hypothetical protein